MRDIDTIETTEVLNELERMYGLPETRATINDAYFKTVEESMVKTISDVWDKKIDESMIGLVRMLDDINSDMTEEMITQLILPYLDENLAVPFYSSPRIRIAVKASIKRSWTGSSKLVSNQLNISPPRSAMVDYKAQQWLQRDTRFWLKHRWDGHTRRKIADTARKVGIEQGLGRRDVGKALSRAFRGVAGESAYYWDVVGSSAITRARSFSSISTMTKAEIKKYQIYSAGDERVCPICGNTHGTIVRVQSAMNIMEESLNEEDPMKVRNIMPWIGYSTKREKEGKKPFYHNKYDNKGNITGKSYFAKEKLSDGKFLASTGSCLPQFHGGCRCGVMAV